MPPLKQHSHFVRLTATLLIATVLQACTSWHVRPLQPAHFSAAVHAGKARLTLTDWSRVTVLSPVIRGDSLFGNRAPSLSPVTLALTSIRGVGVKETDYAKSTLLFAGVGLIALFVFVAVGQSESFGGGVGFGGFEVCCR